MTDDSKTLIAGWLDGDLDAVGQDRLENWLRENPENLDQLVEASIRDQQLREAVQVFENRASAEKAPVVRQSRRRFLPTLAAAAAIVLGLAAALWLFRDAPNSPAIAKVVAAENVRLANRNETLKVGSAFATGPIMLEAGRLDLQLASGVHLEMTGPLEGELIDAMHLRLKSGRLNANMGERGKGFTVYTDAGDVIDLGTEFGIEVDEDGESRVAVFTGKVEVRPHEKDKTQKPRTILLTEGQAARFSVLAGLRRWDQVALAAQAAGISSKPPAGVVKQVRDNLGDNELHPFYGVVDGGMKSGALAYTDKPNPSWRAAEGESFPDWLEGADQIRTYHQFRRRNYYRLHLEIAEPAVVFVLQDARFEAPDWLQNQFTATGTQLRVGPWNIAMAAQPGVIVEQDGPYLTADIWKCEVPAGEVILGPPRDREDEVPVAMYGLAVKPLRDTP